MRLAAFSLLAATGAALPCGPYVAAGSQHSCVVLGEGYVKCWGAASYGQLGQGDTRSVGSSTTPAAVYPISVPGDAKSVSAGAATTCVVTTSRKLYCFGRGLHGALGYSPDSSKAALGQCAPAAAAGAAAGDGTAYPDLGGTGTTKPSMNGAVPLPLPVTSVSTGYDHTCAVTADGSVYCWGLASHGQLGYGK